MRSFEFRSGALSLDLVDTLADRDGANADLLCTVEDIGLWAAGSGMLSFMSGVLAEGRHLDGIKILREAIYRSSIAVVAGKTLGQDDVRILNDAAAGPAAHLILTPNGMELVADDPVTAMFAAVASDAIGLLGSERRNRLRRCLECRMLFFDASPPGKRVWCSSSSGCGNQAKTRRHRRTMQERKDYPC